ncbi:MAG: ATP-binding protein [Ferruginibacter sp.]
MDTGETQIYYVFLIAACIIGALLLLALILSVQFSKKYRKLLGERVEIEIKAIERERTRIANDIHDEPGALLASAKILLSTIEVANEESRAEIKQSIICIDDCMVRLRCIAKGLTPLTVKKKGLKAALEEYISLIKNNQLTIQLESPNFLEIDEYIAINIYRILLEIIQNTLKHSKASKLRIVIEKAPEKLTILTADNGCGFELEKHHNQSMGLDMVARRAEIIGADLNIRSTKNQGTYYNLTLHCNNYNPNDNMQTINS